MPGKMGVSAFVRRRDERFSRSSSLTRRLRKRSSEKGLRRSSASVRGRLMKTPGDEYFFRLYAWGKFAVGRWLLVVRRWQTRPIKRLEVQTNGLQQRPTTNDQRPMTNNRLFSARGRCLQLSRGRVRRDAHWEEPFPDTWSAQRCADSRSAVQVKFA